MKIIAILAFIRPFAVSMENITSTFRATTKAFPPVLEPQDFHQMNYLLFNY
jgi:hypothetical protein